jgi:UDP-N-acetylmuramyl pentapeptide phosphotransferase/UDP-N-acetylglucosamine-1-phosphate transferase
LPSDDYYVNFRLGTSSLELRLEVEKEFGSPMLEAPLFAFLGALVVNLTMTPWVIRYLRNRSMLDIPNARSSHDTPVPRGGGIVIVFTWCLGMVSTWALRFPFPRLGMLAPDGFVVAATIGMCVLAVLGYLDDRRDLNPFLKLFIQVAVAAQALYLSGLRLGEFGLPWGSGWDLGPWGWLASGLWLVGFTNIYNFMDGINGLAFTQLIFGGATFCLLGVSTADYELAISGALAAGSAVGILKYNFPKANVFMGDVGSLPLGFLLALMGLRSAFGPKSEGISFLIPVLILWPFLYDGSFTLINRLVHGRNPVRPHRSHLYQRLVVLGLSHQDITLRYGLAMIFCAAAGYVMQFCSLQVSQVLLGAILVFSAYYTVRIVRRVRAYQTLADHPAD